MIFLKQYTKLLLRTIILYVHLFTRTPLIILFYGISIIGIFGGKDPLSVYCFSIFVVTIILSLFLVILFNTKSIKEEATDFVGRDFCSKYLSHSFAAAKSLSRALLPATCLYAYNTLSAELKDWSHNKAMVSAQGSVDYWVNQNNPKMAQRAQEIMNRMRLDYRYQGAISESFEVLKRSESTQAGL